MERGSSALAYTNLAMGATFILEFIISLIIWQAMTFREHGADVMTAMNDTAWFLFVAITATPALQAVVIGIAVLRDDRSRPVFPRWAGYLNLWVAVMFMPGTITVFFKDGPFAWNGLFVWYMPLTVFFIWMVANTVLLLKAISAQEAEGKSAPPVSAYDVESMASDMRQLKAELAVLSSRIPTN